MHDLLSGYRIIELSTWTFVPTAGALCASWGADVIKIERPGSGDPQRASFDSADSPPENRILMETTNHGKRSVALDLHSDNGHAALGALVADADVFLTNSLEPQLRSMRADVETLRAINPRLVYARGTGHGSHGPDAAEGGYDMSSGWARVGMMEAINPTTAVEPPVCPPAMVDLQAGFNLACGIVASLFARERTGVAHAVDASLLSAGLWMMAPNLLAARMGRRFLPNPGHLAPPIHPLINSYETADGRWLVVVLQESDRYWADFCERIGRRDLIEHPQLRDATLRKANSDLCVREVATTIAGRTLEEWKDAFRGMRGPWSPYQTFAEATRDPQVVATGMIQEVETDRGPVPVMDAPLEFDQRRASAGAPAPSAGEHTQAVLMEVGLDPAVVADVVAVHERALIR